MSKRKNFQHYPIHNEVGITIKPYDYGPPALRPSGMNPNLTVFAGSHGRALAGLPGGIDPMNAEGIDTYPNELELLAEADDVVGNGVFDPNLTHGNVHPEAGVFQDKQSLPGYLDRERFYGPSEVTDATTGRPVEYVPGGAVAFQQGQERTYNDLINLYQTPPRSAWYPGHPQTQSTWIPQEASRGVGDAPPAQPFTMPAWGWVLVGVGTGLAAAYGIKHLKGRR